MPDAELPPETVSPGMLRILVVEVEVKVLLNLHSEHHLPDDVYHRLIQLAADRKTRVIDPPEVALASFNKATLHPRLIAAGISVPPTLIVAREQVADLRLSDADRALLGSPFVIKPSLGYGRRGVRLDATSESDLARSQTTWPDPQLLLQRRIEPRSIAGSPAYFRVYFVFGSTWICWWNCFTDHYRLVTESELKEFGLVRLAEIIVRIAKLTGMNFFSTEIAQTGTGEFVVIDYVNDQCHLLTQSASPANGVPDELVANIARRLVESAQHMIRP